MCIRPDIQIGRFCSNEWLYYYAVKVAEGPLFLRAWRDGHTGRWARILVVGIGPLVFILKDELEQCMSQKLSSCDFD